MNYNKKAVYFFCTDYERDEVAPRVLNYLKNNYPLNLRDYKFDNKNIYPVCTSASSGLGNSAKNLKSISSGGTWHKGYRFSEDATSSDVDIWLKTISKWKTNCFFETFLENYDTLYARWIKND